MDNDIADDWDDIAEIADIAAQILDGEVE